MNESGTPRAALFDIDGTLIDSNELHVKAWSEAFRDAGYTVAVERIRAEIGKGGDNLLPALLPEVGDDERKDIEKRNGERFKDRYIANAKPFPDAAALLRRAHEGGWKVVLASSAKREEVDHYAQLLAVTDILDASTSIDDVDRSKPKPDIFTASLSKVGVAPANALVIGDTVWDVEAAKKSGSQAIALLSGGVAANELKTCGAVALYRDAADLLARYDTSPLGQN